MSSFADFLPESAVGARRGCEIGNGRKEKEVVSIDQLDHQRQEYPQPSEEKGN
jgi:hypothetical protein